LFGNNGTFSDSIADGGKFHGADTRFINFLETFAATINLKFNPVRDLNSHNEIANDNVIDGTAGFDNLIGKLALRWEELALMAQLVQQREDCSAALGIRARNFADTFYNEVSSRPNDF